MIADLFGIDGRQKANPYFPSGLDDFALKPQGRIAVSSLLASPDWALYALDLDRGQAMLVEMPAGTDLSQAPFVYLAQYEHGLRAAVMEIDTLVATSDAITPPAQISFLFSTGRCGSTLASRMLAGVPGLYSLSEPDCLTNIAVARAGHDRDWLVALVRAAVLWSCRPPLGSSPGHVVVKPRSEATLIAELCQQAFPPSRNLFLYRDLVGWAASVHRFEQRILGGAAANDDSEAWRQLWPFLMVGTPLSYLDECFPPDHGPVLQVEFHTLIWDQRIEGYLRALRRGMVMTAIHYDDLNRDRVSQTARLLAGCGIGGGQMDLALKGFAADSHAGSQSAQGTDGVPLSADRRERALALLARLGKRDYLTERLPERTVA